MGFSHASSNASVREQLIEQLRYLIASGHFQVNETLPSTRKLGERVGISRRRRGCGRAPL